MRKRIRLTESQLHKVIKESVKRVLRERQINEVRGWSLEDDDIALVNDSSCGRHLYLVKLWWGSGYQMDCYNAYADYEGEALEYTVAFIEKTNEKLLDKVDEWAENLKQEIMDEKGCEEEDVEEYPEFYDTFYYVDATIQGASSPHYVFWENLTIAEYPQNHNYPMSSQIKDR